MRRQFAPRLLQGGLKNTFYQSIFNTTASVLTGATVFYNTDFAFETNFNTDYSLPTTYTWFQTSQTPYTVLNGEPVFRDTIYSGVTTHNTLVPTNTSRTTTIPVQTERISNRFTDATVSTHTDTFRETPW